MEVSGSMNRLSNPFLDPSVFPTEVKKDEVKDMQEIRDKLSKEQRKEISNLLLPPLK